MKRSQRGQMKRSQRGQMRDIKERAIEATKIKEKKRKKRERGQHYYSSS